MNEESHNLEEKFVKFDKEKCSPEDLFGQQSSLVMLESVCVFCF